MDVGKQRSMLVAGLLAALTTPSVYAAAYSPTFISANLQNTITQLLDLIGTVFNIDLTDPMRVGFVKFLFFLLFFAIYNWSARSFLFRDEIGPGGLSKKTATIVSFTLAAISAWFIPTKLVLDLGSVFSAVAVSALFVIGPTIGALWAAFRTKRASGGGAAEPKTRGDHAQGLLWLGLAMGMMVALGWAMIRGNTGTTIGYQYLFEYVVDWCSQIIGVAFLVKLFQVLFPGTGGSSATTPPGEGRTLREWFNDRGNRNSQSDHDRRMNDLRREQEMRGRENELRDRTPGMVSGVDHGGIPPGTPAAGGTRVRWAANTEPPAIERYEIQYTEDEAWAWPNDGGAGVRHPFNRGAPDVRTERRRDAVFRPVPLGGGAPPVGNRTEIDIGALPGTAARPAGGARPAGCREYQFRVRCVSNTNIAGEWGYGRYGATGTAPLPPPGPTLPPPVVALLAGMPAQIAQLQTAVNNAWSTLNGPTPPGRTVVNAAVIAPMVPLTRMNVPTITGICYARHAGAPPLNVAAARAAAASLGIAATQLTTVRHTLNQLNANIGVMTPAQLAAFTAHSANYMTELAILANLNTVNTHAII